MKPKTNIKLDLSDTERKMLRKQKVKIAELLNYVPDELVGLLGISENRAKELWALADFQRIPSIGIAFAKDMIFLGYYSVAAVRGADGASLTNRYEREKGYTTDPCVEDQFRLVVNFAESEDYTRRWWDFTAERKAYRSQFGYPPDRPVTSWTEIYFKNQDALDES